MTLLNYCLLLVIVFFFIQSSKESDLECMEINLHSLYLPKEADCTSISLSDKKNRCCFLSYKIEGRSEKQLKCVIVRQTEKEIKKVVKAYKGASLLCGSQKTSLSIINSIWIFLFLLL